MHREFNWTLCLLHYMIQSEARGIADSTKPAWCNDLGAWLIEIKTPLMLSSRNTGLNSDFCIGRISTWAGWCLKFVRKWNYSSLEWFQVRRLLTSWVNVKVVFGEHLNDFCSDFQSIWVFVVNKWGYFDFLKRNGEVSVRKLLSKRAVFSRQMEPSRWFADASSA